MAVAMMYPDLEKGGRGQKGSVAERLPDVKRRAVSEARTVLANSKTSATQVLQGGKTLAGTYEK